MPQNLRPTLTRLWPSLALVGILALQIPSGVQAAPAPDPGAASANLQGDDQRAWMQDPHTRAFYQLTVAAFANGPANVDKVRYEHDARAIFRDFGPAMGLSPDAMEEHLRLIPGQMIKIVTDDPKVLTSFDTFIAALVGPP